MLCYYADWHYTECRTLFTIMMKVCYDECRYAECRYAKCRYAECHYAECRYADCRYAECHYAECPSAMNLRQYKEFRSSCYCQFSKRKTRLVCWKVINALAYFRS